MQVTKVRIDELKPSHSSVCAVCTVIIDNELAIHQIKVVRGKNGLFVTFPNNGAVSGQDGKVKYNDIVHPTTNEFRVAMVDAVLQAYKEEQQKLCELN